MATTYTLEQAEQRAQERRDSDRDSFTVWRHIGNRHDFIVRTAAANAPRDFARVVTFWNDGTVTRFAKP